MCIKSRYKRLITFGVPQCSPAGTAKQILIQFWQVIRIARWRSTKNGVFLFVFFSILSRYIHAKKTSNVSALLNMYSEGVTEVERLVCLSEHFSLKTFTFPRTFAWFTFFDKTHNERDTIKSTKVLHCNSSKL